MKKRKFFLSILLCIFFLHESNLITYAEEVGKDNYPTTEGEEITMLLNMDSGQTTTFDEDLLDGNKLEENNNIKGLSLYNYIILSISARKTSYVIRVRNWGIDSVDSVKLKATICKYNGSTVTSYTKDFPNMSPGTKTWIISAKKSATIQETIKVNVTAKDGKDFFSHTFSSVRYNFEGGRYSSLKAYEGHRHHMPSDNINGLSTTKGPCIRMIIGDHTRTASYGSGTSAKQFRSKEKKLVSAGRFLAAQQLGIKDVQKKFGIKYNDAINQMVMYTKLLGYTR